MGYKLSALNDELNLWVDFDFEFQFVGKKYIYVGVQFTIVLLQLPKPNKLQRNYSKHKKHFQNILKIF